MGKTYEFTHSYPQVIHKMWIKLCNLWSYPRENPLAQGTVRRTYREKYMEMLAAAIDEILSFHYNSPVTCIVSYKYAFRHDSAAGN